MVLSMRSRLHAGLCTLGVLWTATISANQEAECPRRRSWTCFMRPPARSRRSCQNTGGVTAPTSVAEIIWRRFSGLALLAFALVAIAPQTASAAGSERIAFARGGQSLNLQIWTMNGDGSDAHPVTAGPDDKYLADVVS